MTEQLDSIKDYLKTHMESMMIKVLAKFNLNIPFQVQARSHYATKDIETHITLGDYNWVSRLGPEVGTFEIELIQPKLKGEVEFMRRRITKHLRERRK